MFEVCSDLVVVGTAEVCSTLAGTAGALFAKSCCLTFVRFPMNAKKKIPASENKTIASLLFRFSLLAF
ncbi:hypothetical protein D3C74_289300 [compost metagenome]